MVLTGIVLQHFRSYSSAHFSFPKKITVIVGPNTAGKSNLIEAIYLLSSGKSFRAEKDTEMIFLHKEIGRVKGSAKQNESDDKIMLEVVITNGNVGGTKSQIKKYLVNTIPRRRADFASVLPAVLFSPRDLEIVISSPSIRREFLDSVLEQTDREYRVAKTEYDKGIRQRNALLDSARQNGIRNDKQFTYWDELVIRSGSIITAKREEFIEFINVHPKDIFDLSVFYERSVISKERLEHYAQKELLAGITLVGPHRDDFTVLMHKKKDRLDIKQFGSRGQQRLAVVQLKLLQILYIEKKLGFRPILLLDDIFSELDDAHIKHILDLVLHQQTIITTTHREFVKGIRKDTDIIELKL